MGQGHAHATGGGRKRRLTVVLGLTGAFMFVEVIGGLATHSLALLADAGHMLTDVAGLAMALIATRFAEQPATSERTYGYHRVEVLAALANAVLLVGIAFYILFEAYQRFQNPPAINGVPVLLIAGVGLVINVVSARALHGGAGSSLNVRAAYLEVLSDMLGSIGVIIAATVIHFTHWYYADPLISVAIGLFILPRTWGLLKEAVGVLLEGTPASISLDALRESVLAIPGVAEAHDLHVWSLTSNMHAMSVHASLKEGADHESVRVAIERLVTSEFGIGHVTVQLETEACEESHP
ncbi:MAG: cation diffusion facilitator family transporter [Candidatus Eisenbacteria bacterium]